ncbi:MAG TPA: hypothetical protein VGE52_15750 [Pirellulales bacterium]
MSTLFSKFFAVALLVVGAGAVSLAAPGAAVRSSALDCCATGAACCFEGSPCCEAGSACCFVGSSCCETGAACCPDSAHASAKPVAVMTPIAFAKPVVATTAKASDCCAAQEACCEVGADCCATASCCETQEACCFEGAPCCVASAQSTPAVAVKFASLKSPSGAAQAPRSCCAK